MGMIIPPTVSDSEECENKTRQRRTQDSFLYCGYLHPGLSDSPILENDIATHTFSDSQECVNEEKQTRSQGSFLYCWDLHLGFLGSPSLENDLSTHILSDS